MNRLSAVSLALCLVPESVGKYPTWHTHSSKQDCFQCSSAKKVNILPEAFTMFARARTVNNLPGASTMCKSTRNIKYINIPAPQPMSEFSVILQHSETSRSCSIGFCHPCELKNVEKLQGRESHHISWNKALFGRIPWLHYKGPVDVVSNLVFA